MHGVPAGYWRDPYVLGFIQMTVLMFAKMATRGKIDSADLGYVLMDVLTAVSSMNGDVIAQDAADLALNKHPDFVRGNEDAMSIILFTYRGNAPGDPLVVEATRFFDGGTLTQAPGQKSDRRSQIAALMVSLSYGKEVRRLTDK